MPRRLFLASFEADAPEILARQKIDLNIEFRDATVQDWWHWAAYKHWLATCSCGPCGPLPAALSPVLWFQLGWLATQAASRRSMYGHADDEDQASRLWSAALSTVEMVWACLGCSLATTA